MLSEVEKLKAAIDQNDLAKVKELMTADPSLHSAPLGYAKAGPLTCVAECRVPFEAPPPARLEMAEWMIQNGSDIHQGGDGPLMRAALNEDRIPMMGLLVKHGANVNADWNQAGYPILFAPCECVAPKVLAWLLAHGADPKGTGRVTALDYLLGTYVRSRSRFVRCVDILLDAGGITHFDQPGVLDIVRGRTKELAKRLDEDPSLLARRYPELDFGSTGARRLLLQGATLLHVAAEFGNVEAIRLLLDRGAQVNAPALTDNNGVGGQTAIFHAVSQFRDFGLEAAQVLIERGADLSLRAKLPGFYERPEEFVDCTPLGYAVLFPGEASKTVAMLRAKGATE